MYADVSFASIFPSSLSKAVPCPVVSIFHFLAQNKNRINKAGELLVTSELSRSQQRNLSDCIQKISGIVAEASEKPHEPTAEDIALRKARYKPSSRTLLVLVRTDYKCLMVCFGCEMRHAGWRRGTRSDLIRRRSTRLSRGVEEWILTKMWTNSGMQL